MAAKSTTKKTSTTATKADVVEIVTEDVVQDKAVADTETDVVKTSTPKRYADDDGIICESITSGELGMIGIKTGINYTWACRGDETEVEYADLVAAVRSNKAQVFKPMFVIKDNEFLSQFPKVAQVYDSMYTLSDFEEIFSLPVDRMKSVIISMPSGVQKSLLNIAATMVTQGKLDSVQKIKALDELFDTKLMLITEISD